MTYVDGGGASIGVQMSAGRITDLNEAIRGEFPYWPPIQLDDIVRFMDGRIAQITTVQAAMHLDHVNSFVCQLTELERTHPINTLSMPSGFRKLALFPRRAASRAMNLESYRRSQSRGAMNRASIQAIDDAPVEGEEDR